MSNSDAVAIALDTGQRQTLLELARSSIEVRLRGGKSRKIALQEYQPELRRCLASFVTLQKMGRLRGCIGNLSASRPLVEDVASNAAAAAFEDPRFEALDRAEYAQLELHISVLGEPRETVVTSRQQLLRQLQPGVDGVILKLGGRSATYLPSVWQQLPDPEQFIGELRRKAGLPAAGWSSDTRVSIYRTCEFGEASAVR